MSGGLLREFKAAFAFLFARGAAQFFQDAFLPSKGLER